MIEPWWQLRAQPEMLGLQLFGDLLERLQMRGCITIPKCMVGDDGEATLQKSAQRSE